MLAASTGRSHNRILIKLKYPSPSEPAPSFRGLAIETPGVAMGSENKESDNKSLVLSLARGIGKLTSVQ